MRTLTSISLCILSITCFANTQQDVQQILDGVNHYRLLHLKAPLKLNAKLSQIAATHSQDMAQRVCPFGHSGWNQRYIKIRQTIPNTMQAGENVAYGYKDIDSVVKGWINSSGHRANILGHYNRTGIAIVYDNRHRPYYTQIFAYEGTSSPTPSRVTTHSSAPRVLTSLKHQLTKLF